MTQDMEKYFRDTVTLPGEERRRGRFTDAERAFLEIYVGMDYEKTLAEQGLAEPAAVKSVGGPMGAAEGGPGEGPGEGPGDGPGDGAATDEAAGPGAHEAEEDGFDLETAATERESVQLVGFSVAGQEFCVPIDQVQEVIRATAPAKLPSAPPFVAGMMNLRGRIVPLVDMARLLGLGQNACAGEGFVVICRRKGLLLGLMVDRISTMHRASGKDMELGVESKVGVNAEFLAGLLNADNALIKIVSIDVLFQRVLMN